MIQWQYFPKSDAPTALVKQVVSVFESIADEIDSASHDHNSNTVLRYAAEGLRGLGFTIESGKARDEKIRVPVLFGMNGAVAKAFDADGYHRGEGFVIEVEAGRAVVNNQFLKDFFQACTMHDVHYLCIAVRNTYKGTRDLDRIITFFDTLYASRRLHLPLKGLLLLGY